MKKLFVILLILLTSAWAGMSKLYIGNEEGQLILGIEGNSISTNPENTTEGGGTIDLRTYFKKTGIMINGNEYGAMPGKTLLLLALQGTNEEGQILKIKGEWDFLRDYYDNSLSISKLFWMESGYGRGQYRLYQ